MLSVITPSYGQLGWLRLCVASVADQEGVSVEHIVQDGGTEGIADAAALPDAPSRPGYRLALHVERDEGMYDAINRGLRRSAGDICGYLNCDEQYLPGTLESVTEFFNLNPETNVLFGDAILVDQDGMPLSYRRCVLPSPSHVRLVHLNTLSCAMFFRRRLLDRGFYFDTQWKAIGDTAWIHALLKAKVSMSVLKKPLAIFTFTGKNLGATRVSEFESVKLRGTSWLDLLRRPAAIVSHRLRKGWAGAYYRRDLEIEIYTRSFPHQRQRITATNVGFDWPRR